MKLWLDDERPAPAGWEWVKDAHAALWRIRGGSVSEASLDHDLGDDPWTGYWLLVQIETDVVMNYPMYSLPLFRIHSANPVGRKRMAAALQSIERLREGRSAAT